LQHNTEKYCRRRAAGCTEFSRDRVASRRVKLGKRHSRKTREMIERLGDHPGIAVKRREDVGLYGGVIRAGCFIFGARWNHHGGDDAEVAALPG